MNRVEQYAKKYLGREIMEIETSSRMNSLNKLSVYEKAIILNYTENGYESLNEYLRKFKGKEKPELGEILANSLSKLDNYSGLVYRCVTLTKSELDVYNMAYDLGKPIIEFAFVSTSKSKTLAYLFGKNTIFEIYSRTGKDIEKIAKFGSGHPQNEREVLFKAGKSFNVINILKEGSYTLIIMEERK